MTKASWKAVERAIGRFLGTDRTGALRADNADLISDTFSYEVKSRKDTFRVIEKHLSQAERNANGRMPVVIVHPDNGRHKNDLVIMRLSTFRDVLNIGDIEP